MSSEQPTIAELNSALKGLKFVISTPVRVWSDVGTCCENGLNGSMRVVSNCVHTQDYMDGHPITMPGCAFIDMKGHGMTQVTHIGADYRWIDRSWNHMRPGTYLGKVGLIRGRL